MSGIIGIIANPHSKLNKRNPQILEHIRAKTSGFCDFYATKSLDHLDHVCRSILQKKTSMLAICGGDGTISRTITSILKSYEPKTPLPKIAVLKGGTINLIASQISQKGHLYSIIDRLVEISKRQEQLQMRSIQTIKVNSHYGFLYADGSNVKILEEFYRNKSGVLGASWLAAKLVASFLGRGPLIKRLVKEEYRSIQISKTDQLDVCSLGNLVGTISKLPLGFPLLPHATNHLDKFQLTTITCPKEKLLWYLPSIMLQHKEGSNLGKHTLIADRLTIRGSASFPYTIDGEIFQSGHQGVTIQSGPKFTFVTI